MRKILYVIIGISLCFLPLERLDIAKLQPVQTVAIKKENGHITILTDTDDKGTGEMVESALQDLEEKTPGVIYLDTAQYLLVAQNAIDDVAPLRKYLSNRVKVTLWDGEGSVQSAAEYLDVRKDLPRLKDWMPEKSKKDT